MRAASVVLLPCVPSSVAVARRRIAAELREAGLFPAAVADAALVTSELLSNAILHARPLPDACIRVSWILTPTSVEVIVSDGGSATRPRASRPSLSSIGGRGLGIVEHLCSSWGVRADERGTTVWAVLPAARAAVPGRAAAVAVGRPRAVSVQRRAVSMGRLRVRPPATRTVFPPGPMRAPGRPEPLPAGRTRHGAMITIRDDRLSRRNRTLKW